MNQATIAKPEPRGGPIVDRMVSEEFANHLSGLDADALPAASVDAAKRLLLDFVSVALRGSAEPSSRTVAAALDRMNPSGDKGTVTIGYPTRRSKEYAALVNGVSLHGLELDDIHPVAAIHPGAAVFPAALAVGESVGANGRDLLAAVIVGYEISCRLSRSLVPSEHGGHGFHSTATCGVFAAAGVASRLMGLSAGQMLNAFGIAGSQAAGLVEFLSNGAWTKRMHPGWAAHGGIIAAEFAAGGFTGPNRIFEGRSGFLRSYSDRPKVENVLDGLGGDHQILGVAIKPHAACRYSQAAIDGVLELATTHDIRPEQVEGVTVGIFGGAIPLVAEPLAVKRRPRSVVDAQFSIHFAVATALTKRSVTLSDYRPERMAAPEIHALADRVECVHDASLDPLFPRLWPATVDIRLRDGRVFSRRTEKLHGDPDDPLSWEELIGKAKELTQDMLPAGRLDEIIAAIRNLENGSAKNLASLLVLKA